LIKDGDSVEVDTEIIKVNGKARSILKAERTSLNILGRMSGVATETNKLVKEAKQVNKKIRIAATRKTLPGLRIFDKKAVKAGGGDTHRFQLDDAVLIKDNHLKITGSISATIKLARKNVSFTKKIEVEVSSVEEALEAVEAGADIILLDNMVPQEISKVITILREKQLRKGVFLEASGGIKIENIRMYSETGVDAVSLGVITHSAKNIDFGLEIV
jgi:nicotinate-nucleotide pyrophosphorylase (carboxylating)